MKRLVLLLVAILLLSPIAAQAFSIGSWNSWPMVGQKINDRLTGYVGFNYLSNYNNKATTWGLVKLDYNLCKLGEVQTKLGVDYWGSNPYYDSALECSYGASFMPLNNVSVGLDIMLVSFYNSINVASTDILPSARVGMNLIF